MTLTLPAMESFSLKITSSSAVFIITTTTCLLGVKNAVHSKVSRIVTSLSILTDPRGTNLLNKKQSSY